jgi:hypothetical protein
MKVKPSDAPGAVLGLLSQVTCPHCWERFAPEQVLWISEHVDLLGDPLLGPEQQQRFLPSRFTIDGDALDSRGMTCRSQACPKCHSPIPRAMLELEPLFVSILGAPASGKSYLLTAMTWKLRQVFPHHFKVAFSDADPVWLVASHCGLPDNSRVNRNVACRFLSIESPSIYRLIRLCGGTEPNDG